MPYLKRGKQCRWIGRHCRRCHWDWQHSGCDIWQQVVRWRAVRKLNRVCRYIVAAIRMTNLTVATKDSHSSVSVNQPCCQEGFVLLMDGTDKECRIERDVVNSRYFRSPIFVVNDESVHKCIQIHQSRRRAAEQNADMPWMDEEKSVRLHDEASWIS